jgi:NIPSNAP protein
VITCYLRYTIDPYKLAAFERYSRLILPLAAKYGGVHHGAFLPHEGPNNIAVHLFSFPSLAEYERYRTAVRDDEAAKAALALAEETRCILSFERSFMRPIFAAEPESRAGARRVSGRLSAPSVMPPRRAGR